jgi:hypothetical protein
MLIVAYMLLLRLLYEERNLVFFLQTIGRVAPESRHMRVLRRSAKDG